MARSPTELPEALQPESQERPRQVDVAGVCTEALTAAVTRWQKATHQFGFGHEETEAINRMYT